MSFSYDLHLHSCLSPCGDDAMTPPNIANMAALLGLDLIAVTDHNSCRNAGAVMEAARLLDLPLELYTPIFAMARIAGWSAHRVEELINMGKIIRPAYKYVGTHTDYIPMSDR